MGATVKTRFPLAVGMKVYHSEVPSIRIKRLHRDAQLPVYAHGPLEDAGMDLRAVEGMDLPAGKPVLVNTGLAIELPPGFEAQIRFPMRPRPLTPAIGGKCE